MTTRRKRKTSGSNMLPIILSLIGATVLVGGAYAGVKYLWYDVIRKPYNSFKADSLATATIVRDFTHKESPAATLPAYLQDPQTLTRIRQGAAVEQRFSKTTPNGTETRSCSIQGWIAPSRLASGPQSENDRNTFIQQQFLPECGKLLEWVNERGSYTVARLIIVDRSGGVGVNKPEAMPTEFIEEEVGLPKLEESHKLGDTIKLFGCVISAERQVDCKTSQADKNNPLKSVSDVDSWLSEKHEDTKETSFYEAFYNIIDWFTANGYQIPGDIKIISDTIENSPETVSFYKLFADGKLKDQSKFPPLFDQVFNRKMKAITNNGLIDNPDTKTVGTLLAGKSVTIVGPPYGKGPVRDRIEQSLAFAKYSFGERMHANVVIRYR